MSGLYRVSCRAFSQKFGPLATRQNVSSAIPAQSFGQRELLWTFAKNIPTTPCSGCWENRKWFFLFFFAPKSFHFTVYRQNVKMLSIIYSTRSVALALLT